MWKKSNNEFLPLDYKKCKSIKCYKKQSLKWILTLTSDMETPEKRLLKIWLEWTSKLNLMVIYKEKLARRVKNWILNKYCIYCLDFH